MTATASTKRALRWSSPPKNWASSNIWCATAEKPSIPRKLYEAVWNEQYLPSSSNTIMVHIMKLRKKVEDDPNRPTLIQTIWGRGYQIDR